MSEQDRARMIVFGALSPTIADQLGVSGPPWRAFQADANAITRLKVRGVLSEREAHAARTRLVKRIERQKR